MYSRILLAARTRGDQLFLKNVVFGHAVPHRNDPVGDLLVGAILVENRFQLPLQVPENDMDFFQTTTRVQV